ncbi:cytochrome c oxidase subunit 8C, mitochondrial-like [Vicugna pacos]|uniref:Cytochrome c oxidase subunit 8 n=1 Tax=Vicugna pacos TaxID=30538 RepID=A0ABM5DGH0_VICPA
MPRLPVLCLLPPRRVTLLVLQRSQRQAHSDPPRQHPVSTMVSWGPPAARAAQTARGELERVAEAVGSPTGGGGEQEVAIALMVLFTAFLTPSGYVLSNLNHFRRD